MNCPRCNGLMFEGSFQDLEDDTGQINFSGWKCFACGEIIDPVILFHRETHLPEERGKKVRERMIPFVVARRESTL